MVEVLSGGGVKCGGVKVVEVLSGGGVKWWRC